MYVEYEQSNAEIPKNTVRDMPSPYKAVLVTSVNE